MEQFGRSVVLLLLLASSHGFVDTFPSSSGTVGINLCLLRVKSSLWLFLRPFSRKVFQRLVVTSETFSESAGSDTEVLSLGASFSADLWIYTNANREYVSYICYKRTYNLKRIFLIQLHLDGLVDASGASPSFRRDSSRLCWGWRWADDFWYSTLMWWTLFWSTPVISSCLSST